MEKSVSDKITEEMLKFFDAVSGETGPYGWIYAAEYNKYGIEHAEFEGYPSRAYLDLYVRGKYLMIFYSFESNKFCLNFMDKGHIYCKSLPELFDHLSTYEN